MSLVISRWFLIFSSFLGGMVLMFLQLPFGLYWLCPLWLVLILFYWTLVLPKYINFSAAIFIGFFLDIVYHVPIGEHVLALILVTYVINSFRSKIVMLDVIWASLAILGLVFFYQLLLCFFQHYIGAYFNFWHIFWGTVMSGLIWPIIALPLSNLQLRLQA